MLEKNDAAGLVSAVDFKRMNDRLEGYADQPRGTIVFRGVRVEYEVLENFAIVARGRLFRSQYTFRLNGATFYAVPYATNEMNLVAWESPQ